MKKDEIIYYKPLTKKMLEDILLEMQKKINKKINGLDVKMIKIK